MDTTELERRVLDVFSVNALGDIQGKDISEVIRYCVAETALAHATDVMDYEITVNGQKMPVKELIAREERAYTKFASSQVSKSPDFRQAQVGGEHYKSADVQPWDLQATMKTSGKVSVDARRADIIKYVWRIKGDRPKQIEDLKKAAHCLQAAIETLSNP